jgi:serralysin
MKKNGLLSDDIWVFQTSDAGEANSAFPLGTTHDPVFRDGGDLFPLAAAGSGFDLVLSAPKPVASIATLADYLVNGFWQYNSTIAHHFASSTITYNITGLNAAEQFLAQTAMQGWSEVANINFVQTSGAANITFTHNGTMQAYTTGNWSGTGAIISQTVNISTDWVTTDGGANDGKTGIDSYAYQTYIHEIGHALGLGHQGPYNGTASYSTNAVYANDTWQYSIMSYFVEQNYSGSSNRYVITPQMADIYAVGLMYGAATSTRTGDTVYGFNSNAGAVFNFALYSPATALTIYDSGGNDTLDVSGYSSAQTIDLHPGSFSSVGGLVNNIGIALNAVIEKAIGGAGADRLIASDTGSQLLGGGGSDTLIGGAGNDRLYGGSGVDNLTGGGGVDTFVFLLGDSSAASGLHDRITDFGSGVDLIDLSGYDAISSTGSYDQFRFISTTAFHGSAGELNYFYNSASGVTTLQGDTNGDGVADFGIDLTGNITIAQANLIGAYSTPVTIEAFGATTLTMLGSLYYLYANGTTSGPTLKYSGAAIAVGQFDPYVPVAVEQTASGYQVALKYAAGNSFSIWNTDSNGNFISFAVYDGNSTALKALETSFQQDLNGDGTIGAPAPSSTVIEALGSTSLAQAGNNFYLNNIGTGTGPTLKYAGAAITVGQFDPYTPVGVEQTASGYQVALKYAAGNSFSIWNTDSNGNFVSYAVYAGDSTALKSLETNFQQDLNGDGTIGTIGPPAPSGTVIEAQGSTSLVQSGNNFYLNNISSGTGPTLKYAGAAITVGQFDPYVPVAVEQTGGGYQVALKYVAGNQFSIWKTDSNGNYVSFAVYAGDSTALKSLETSFHQDLNGDGTIGVPSTVIEAAGSTSLIQANGNFYLNNIGSGTGPTLKYAGAAITVGQFDPYVPVAVEQTAGGYQVALKYAAGNEFSIWNTDSNGNFISFAVYAGNSATLKSLEITFGQDLNGDSTIGAAGITPQTVAATQGTGNTSLDPLELSDTFKFAFEAGQSAVTLPDQAANDHRWVASGAFHALLSESSMAHIDPALYSFGHETLPSPAGHPLDSETHHFIVL